MPLPPYGHPVPPAGPQALVLVRAQLGQVVRVASLSPRVVGVYAHFVDGSGSWCWADEGPCEECSRGTPRRWRGYLYGHDYSTHRACLIELPADAVRSNSKLADPAQDLRGAVLYLKRVGPNRNSRVVVDVRLSTTPPRDRDPAPDVLFHLRRLWNALQREGAPPLAGQASDPEPWTEGGEA